MHPETRRRTPEELLAQAQSEEAREKHGRLKVFLGYASGVGKSFRMLDEGRRRAERGQDVVVGAIQTPAAPETEAILSSLEIIPLLNSGGIPAMDVPAILKRHPGVCLIDGLAWDNPPGSANRYRWQDVRQLLEAGITVIASVNIHYIEELRDQVEAITGKRTAWSIPREFLYAADEIVVVDAPPEMCQAHSEALGVSASVTEQKLASLREIALLLAADVVDRELESYLRHNGITASFGTQERILVCITPYSAARQMIESGRRNAERFHGELIVANVKHPRLNAAAQALLDDNLAMAERAGARVEVLEGEDPIAAILEFAHERKVTQVFMGHSEQTNWWGRWTGGPVGRLIRGAQGMDVRVFPH